MGDEQRELGRTARALLSAAPTLAEHPMTYALLIGSGAGLVLAGTTYVACLFLSDAGPAAATIAAPALLAVPIVSSLAYAVIQIVGRDHQRDELLRHERRSNARASRLLAMVSHELRTPLNGILGLTRALVRADLPTQEHEHAEAVLASAKTMHGLVDDVLSLARVDQDAWQLAPVPFSPHDLVASVAALVESMAVVRNLQTRFEVAPEVPSALIGDDARIRQVLVNLVGNALKFTREGTVRLTIRLSPGPTPSAPQNGTETDLDLNPAILFEVVDTGIGISETDLATVFEEFSQVGNRRAREQGSGLGLSISQRLVAKLGGELKVESTVGEGSRFHFALPLKTAPDGIEPESHASLVAPLPQASHLRVLLVEDNKTNRDVALLMLRDLGITPEIATNGAEGLERVHQQAFDVVLMDIQMPVMDGLTATRRIRALRDDGLPRVVMLTANALPAQHREAYDAGADAIVEKPIEIARLRQALMRVEPTLAFESNSGRHEEALSRLRTLTGGDTGLFRSMIVEHIENVQELVGNVRIGLERDDIDVVCRAAHTLKSSSAMFGSMSLSGLAARIERAASRDDAIAAADLLVPLQEAAEAATTRLRAVSADLEVSGEHQLPTH